MTDVHVRNDLTSLVETLIEGQALLVSSVYVDLINLGLIEPETAAARLRGIAELAKSPLQRHPQAAAALAARMHAYADGLGRGAGGDVESKFRLIVGGRKD